MRAAAAEKILPLLKSAPETDTPLTYVSFWDDFRLASQAMKAPGPIGQKPKCQSGWKPIAGRPLQFVLFAASGCTASICRLRI